MARKQARERTTYHRCTINISSIKDPDLYDWARVLSAKELTRHFKLALRMYLERYAGQTIEEPPPPPPPPRKIAVPPMPGNAPAHPHQTPASAPSLAEPPARHPPPAQVAPAQDPPPRSAPVTDAPADRAAPEPEARERDVEQTEPPPSAREINPAELAAMRRLANQLS